MNKSKMEKYFNINYEFDRHKVHQAIQQRLTEDGSDYICVADGVIASITLDDPEYLKIVNGGMFSICDSNFVPLYIKWIYGKRYTQYCGSQIFEDIIRSRKYRMLFLGANKELLDALRNKLIELNPEVTNMTFSELPFCSIEQFDYPAIAKMVCDDGADIIWVSLGAPKQEIFMSRLRPHLNHGVMIAVGAAFKFFSGTETSRAPEWMIRNHLEFLHRIFKEPKKQIPRCLNIIKTLPRLLLLEIKNKRQSERRDY
ncbi:MAG: WecB/TagA/CpsF family glycosyltransferase [Lachnoclostridium sp.]|nr:WecB/TagA/CpsF family glycosyltransferase [Lachnoclostridium sp.]